MASAAKQPANRPRPQSPTKTGLKLATRRREHHTCRSLLSLPPPHPPPPLLLSPQTKQHSKQQCKRYRANTPATAKQALQGKRPSNRSSLPRSPPCSIHLAVSFEGGGGRAALQEDFSGLTTEPPAPPSRSPPVKRECRFFCPLGWLRSIVLRPRSVGHVAAAAISASGEGAATKAAALRRFRASV